MLFVMFISCVILFCTYDRDGRSVRLADCRQCIIIIFFLIHARKQRVASCVANDSEKRKGAGVGSRRDVLAAHACTQPQ